MPQCPRCQQSVADDDAFCRHCGEALREAAPGSSRRVFMEEMAADFARRLKERADDPDALYNIGLSLLHSQRFAEAVDNFRRIVELLPSFGDAWTKLAISLWNSGQCEEAWKVIEQAARQMPDDCKIASLRRRMSAALGQES